MNDLNNIFKTIAVSCLSLTRLSLAKKKRRMKYPPLFPPA
jgi:hypothetical protein